MSLDFLFDMAWKSALIAGLGLALLFLLRRRSATDRVAVLRATVLLLLALPVIAALGPNIAVENPLPIEAEATPALAGAQTERSLADSPSLRAVAEQATLEIPWLPILLGLYAAGLLSILGRLGAGLLTLRSWARRATPLREFNWRIAFDRGLFDAGIRQPVQLLESPDTPAPLGWGWRRPSILIDRASAARPEDAPAIVAHELAHIASRDWPHLMAARLAIALFWFNPLVWRLERLLVQAAEEAADMHAIERLDPAGYAQALVSCIAAPVPRALPATAMVTTSGLGRRVAAVLDAAERGRGSGSAWTVLGIAACVIAATPIAAVDLRPANVEPAAQPAARPRPVAAAVPLVAPVATPVAKAAVEPVAPAEEAAKLEQVAWLLDQQPPAPPAPPEPPAPAAAPTPPPPAPVASPAPPAPATPPPAPDWRAMRAAPPAPPAPPAAPEFRAPPVAVIRTPPVHVFRAPPVHVSRAPHVPPYPAVHMRRFSEEELEELRAVGATPEMLTEMAQAMGRARISVSTVVELRTMGLTPQKLREFAEAGYARRRSDDYIELATLGVTPAFIRAMAAVGFSELSVDELTELRMAGVSPQFASRMRRERGSISVDELVELRATGGH